MHPVIYKQICKKYYYLTKLAHAPQNDKTQTSQNLDKIFQL